MLDVDDAGKVTDMAILIRPLTALQSVAAAMAKSVDPALLAEH